MLEDNFFPCSGLSQIFQGQTCCFKFGNLKRGFLSTESKDAKKKNTISQPNPTREPRYVVSFLGADFVSRNGDWRFGLVNDDQVYPERLKLYCRKCLLYLLRKSTRWFQIKHFQTNSVKIQYWLWTLTLNPELMAIDVLIKYVQHLRSLFCISDMLAAIYCFILFYLMAYPWFS